MNSRARHNPAPKNGPDSEHTAHISQETISRLKAECAPEPASPLPSSLSGLAAPVIGTQLEEPFAMVCELASGSTATVYLAVDHRAEGVEKFVAVKRYRPEVTQRADFADLFIHEMRLARVVDHPNLCKVLDYGRAGTSYYTAMEFLQGEPLSKVLTASGFLNLTQRSPRLIARLVASLAEGLHAVHSLRTEDGPAEAVHQDVTSNNLFVLYDGNVRVTDFGTAWTRDVAGKKNPANMSYLAPEQLERGALDARVDIWALGVVLWELLAGQKLFRCSSEREAAVEITARRIPPPSEHHPQVPAELDRIVLKALSRNRNKRYSSAHEFATDLEHYLSRTGEPIAPSAVGEWLVQLFPTGIERGRGLIELANTLTRLPRVAEADEALPPISGQFTPAAQDDGGENTTHIYTARLENTLRSAQGLSIEGPVETVSFKDIPTTVRRPKRRGKRSLGASVVPFAAAFAVVLLGFAAGQRMFSRSATSNVKSVPAPATQLAQHAAAPAVQLSAAIATPRSAPPKPSIVHEATPIANEPKPVAHEAAALPAPAPTLAHETTLATKKAASAASNVASKEPEPVKTTIAKPAAAVATASTLATQPGAVFVTTPGGGDVYDRGRLLGHAPGEFELSPGWHTLIVKSGTDNRAVTVQVPAGAAIMVSVPATKP